VSAKKRLYIICQIIGWGSYILIAYVLNQLSGVSLSAPLILTLASAFTLGIGLSHVYREIIIRNDWLKLNILRMIPRFILGSLALAILFQFAYSGLTYLIFSGKKALNTAVVFQELAGWMILFTLWSLIYFFYHFFKNYKAEEIKNLRWEAARNEIELNKLKSQLNPHFIFNSMNSIRALVEENPKIAKQAITQLSNILRSNLLMGKQRLIHFSEELKLVHDYLAIEGYRYEERLKVSFDIPPKSKHIMVPPLMIQTLVENGIKHGIAHLPEGGTLVIEAKLDPHFLIITITNSGQYDSNKISETGFGIENTQERLRLLFAGKASFEIKNKNKTEVICVLKLPQNIDVYES
tara:strand:- start:35689 stop:36741 length:1053 start_codon:yes stop_codon:yes gene_type:complete